MMLEHLGTHGGRGNSYLTQKLIQIRSLNVTGKVFREKQ